MERMQVMNGHRMGNYFYLELNTQPPRVTVVPNIIKTLGITEIKIISDEEMENFQDIYIIDSLGNRHDIIFDFNPMFYSKSIDFKNFPMGLTRIYITVKDTVDNISETVREIYVGTLSVTISIEEPQIDLSYETIPIDMEVVR